ncbi:MAG: TraR/DksA C4-type zinc finger protein [Bacteriovoracaceae bacterium]|nr:TraR/DksA C4-type zinc finger protein [Bacteriovoracaceae bacterium]
MAVGEIGKIKRALLKIKDGTYGNCEECGERISMKRLEALMYATKCVGCAEPVK